MTHWESPEGNVRVALPQAGWEGSAPARGAEGRREAQQPSPGAPSPGTSLLAPGPARCFPWGTGGRLAVTAALVERGHLGLLAASRGHPLGREVPVADDLATPRRLRRPSGARAARGGSGTAGGSPRPVGGSAEPGRRQPRAGWVRLGYPEPHGDCHSTTALPTVRFLSAVQASARPWADVAGAACDSLRGVGIRGDPRRFPCAGRRDPREAPPRGQSASGRLRLPLAFSPRWAPGSRVVGAPASRVGAPSPGEGAPSPRAGAPLPWGGRREPGVGAQPARLFSAPAAARVSGVCRACFPSQVPSRLRGLTCSLFSPLQESLTVLPPRLQGARGEL